MAGISKIDADAGLSAGVSIRPATESDVDFLAWVMLSASRSHLPVGIWEYLNGQSGDETLDFLRRLATTETVHWCHWSRFVVAEVDGTPAAGMCGFDPVPHGMNALLEVFLSVLEAGGLAPEDVPGVIERGAVVSVINLGYAENSWVVENVATVPEFRRQGLVDALLAHLIADGAAQGFSIGQISVLIGNEPARRAYLKAGFEPDSERREPEFEEALGCPGAERLLMPLLA